MIQVQVSVSVAKNQITLECNRLEREDATKVERAAADAIHAANIAAMQMIVKSVNEGGGKADFNRLLRPDEIDAAAVRQRCEAAMQVVSDLCTGKRNWMMSIPARPDYDPDLVIGAALADIPKLLKALGEE